ncbi:MAG: exopolysaccharide biosynthesis polyprenyl glycosylphosphotransferase [Actinomycetota bacterium]
MTATIEREHITTVRSTSSIRLRRALVVLSDVGAVASGGAIGARLAPGPGVALTQQLAYAALMLLAMMSFRLYSSRLATVRTEELHRVWRSGVLALLLFGVAAISTGSSVDLRAGLALLAPTVVAVSVERELLRRWFAARRQAGEGLWASILIAGEQEGKEFREAIDDDGTSPHVIVGQVDPETCESSDVLLTQALALARRTEANGVVVVQSALDRHAANRLVRGLLDAGLYVDLSSPLADISTERLATRNLGPSLATWIAPRPRGGWRARAKRAFDLFVTLSALLILAPVLAAVALAVKLSSPGPVFFRQERVGRGGDPFDMMKFRSMVANAEELLGELEGENEGAGPLFKMKSDPRVTRVGRFIRKTSLDELPQLINVLRNEMSLVGPRPALRAEMAEWDPDLYARLQVKPGITGMWQVSGRSGTSFDEYTRLDLYYVNNWSLLVDLSILARTVPAVVRSDGAF